MWSDPSLNMAFGNQWMNPALYQHMNNEQVDWASLAQQWIKMKETSHTLQPGQHVRPIVCETNTEAPRPPTDIQNTLNASGPSKTISNRNTTVNSVAGNNIEKPSAWNTLTWQQQQQWNWNWNPNTTPLPLKPPIMETVTSVRPPYVAPPVLPKPETYAVNNSTRNFNTNSYWAGSSNTRVPPSTESEQWNKPSLVTTLDDKNQDSSYIDAAKRKQLPAWIREGLEKMEREKRRKIEQEQSNSESEFQSYHDENTSIELHNISNQYNSETVMADEEIEPDPLEVNADEEFRKTDFIKSESPSLIPRKSKAQIWEDTMLSLRQILTKLLMDVTNDMMLNAAKEMLKTTLHTDTHGNQNQTSLAGKLGLGVYGSASESSGESDDENTISSRKPSNRQDSDEAIQERLLKRQREFSNIEARILMELDKLEDREKLVRSKFDSSVKLSGEVNDTGSQVVENVQTKGRSDSEVLNPKVNNKGNDKSKPEWSGETSVKNGNRKKKSKKSSSSDSSSNSESSESEDTDSKYSRKSDKYRSRSSNTKSKAVVRKRSRSRSRSYTRSKRSRSRSRRRSSSRSRRNDRKSTSSYRSKRSRTPVSKHGSSRKRRGKRDSSSSSSGSRSTRHRYRR
ncbi:arginine/serine-rich protein PNISR-like isoform X2 [Adelges cooleyi]|uniref:arginine/serine-rich protein PNISR-like isoform X2 n=1 Tax=Adelges cooleyi TaxID=133065 RepID=UPI00217FF81E|nr:arginine/serine-rich protein PNISR-like isoform X2 [Adelges cooleyi]